MLLDNCERVLTATASAVAALLAACPALQILATSRAPLRIRGEQLVPVNPLPVPRFDPASSPDTLAESDAVALLVDRARMVRPDFVLTARHAVAIADICRRLDGLPLAIELAAARLRILSVDALLTQMHDPMHLLQGGPRDLPARQQTLRDTVAWSYGLLSDGDQRLFRHLAVFAGGWTLEAAAAVGTLSLAEAHERVERLVDQSLVRSTGTHVPRFAMLETIREFGQERLAESGADQVRRAHQQWVTELVEAVWPSRAATPISFGDLRRLDQERDNIRAALAWTM